MPETASHDGPVVKMEAPTPGPALVPEAAAGAPVGLQALQSRMPLAPPPTSALPSPALSVTAPPSCYVPTSPAHALTRGVVEPPPPPFGHSQAEALAGAAVHLQVQRTSFVASYQDPPPQPPPPSAVAAASNDETNDQLNPGYVNRVSGEEGMQI